MQFPQWTRRPTLRTRRNRMSRGQALAEFALVLPVLITLTGAAMDFARVYQASITLQGATRNAAEFVATRSADMSAAQTQARRVVCTETKDLPGFVPGSGGNVATCTAPIVNVTSFTRSTTAPGANSTYPLGTATVYAEFPFRTVIPWPWLPDGAWDIGTTQTYSVIQGR